MSANAETTTAPKQRRSGPWTFWRPTLVITLWLWIGIWQSWAGWQVLIVGAGVAATDAVCLVASNWAKNRRSAAAAGGSGS